MNILEVNLPWLATHDLQFLLRPRFAITKRYGSVLLLPSLPIAYSAIDAHRCPLLAFMQFLNGRARQNFTSQQHEQIDVTQRAVIRHGCIRPHQRLAIHSCLDSNKEEYKCHGTYVEDIDNAGPQEAMMQPRATTLGRTQCESILTHNSQATRVQVHIFWHLMVPLPSALRITCIPVGSPRRVDLDGSAKRKMRVSWDTLERAAEKCAESSPRFAGTCAEHRTAQRLGTKCCTGIVRKFLVTDATTQAGAHTENRHKYTKNI